ncbi:MAG: hypothetical protein RIF32_11050 [Leptospirales bacterium]|jgi:nitrate reductase assembly molybdenum cofactor insertion protein NarJ
MKTMTKADLKTVAARLVEVFELAPFTKAQALNYVQGEDLDRLITAQLVCEQYGLFGDCTCTNSIPPAD